MKTLLITVLLGLVFFIIGTLGIKFSKTPKVENFYAAMGLAGITCVTVASTIILAVLFHRLLDSI